MRVLRCLISSLVFAATCVAPAAVETASAQATPAKATPIIPAPMAAQSSPFPVDRTFVAVTYKGQAFKDDRPTLLVSSSFRGSGFSACNNWSATIVPHNDQKVAVGPMAITKRTCDARLMHNEQVFLFVVRTAQTWYFDGRTLTLTSPYGPIVFEPSV